MADRGEAARHRSAFCQVERPRILDASFTLADAHEIVARDAGYASWASATKGLKEAKSAEPAAKRAQAPHFCVAYPQVFVSDVRRAAEFYKHKLGFAVDYLYGEPPYYALVSRDGVGVNLRHVDAPAIETGLRQRESLLSASFVVEQVKDLFLEFQGRGVDFDQTLKLQPWDASDFIVRDPDGNLLCFASPVSDNDKQWSKRAATVK